MPEPILRLPRLLDKFRNTHARRARIPDALRESAVELAREHGLYAVRISPTGSKDSRCAVPATMSVIACTGAMLVFGHMAPMKVAAIACRIESRPESQKRSPLSKLGACDAIEYALSAYRQIENAAD
jgi:hypothetical protein